MLPYIQVEAVKGFFEYQITGADFFFSLDGFFEALKLAVVTVFSHFVLAPPTAATNASATRKNRLKNIFAILCEFPLVGSLEFYFFHSRVSLAKPLKLLICLMDTLQLYDVPSESISVFIQFHYPDEKNALLRY